MMSMSDRGETRQTNEQHPPQYHLYREEEQKAPYNSALTASSRGGDKETGSTLMVGESQHHHHHHRHHRHGNPAAPGSITSNSDDISDTAASDNMVMQLQQQQQQQQFSNSSSANTNAPYSSAMQAPTAVPASSATAEDGFHIADWNRFYDSNPSYQDRQETLMTVYENLTHSSTPQDTIEGVTQHQQQQQQQQHQQQQRKTTAPPPQQQQQLGQLCLNESMAHSSSELMNVYDTVTSGQPLEQPWTFQAEAGGNRSCHVHVPIPPIRGVDMAALSAPQPPNTLASTAGTRRSSGSTTSSSSRSLRKRTAAAANLNTHNNILGNNSDAAIAAMSNTDHSNNKDETGSNYSGGSTSRSGNKSRRKGGKDKDKEDGRWSKRFTWPEDLHRDFCSAIFDVGLKHASPATLMECMPKHEQITSERVKSHLQKYRLHRAKSKREFMSSYEEAVQKLMLQKPGSNHLGSTHKLRSLSSGEVPAHLTYATLTGLEVEQVSAPEVSNVGTTELGAPAQAGSSSAATESKQQQRQQQQGSLTASLGADDVNSLFLPRLTEDEKRSPLGASMGYLMGLFFSLKQQLMAQRVANAQQLRLQQGGNVASAVAPLLSSATVVSSGTKQNQPVTAVFDSFVAGNPPSGPGAELQQQQQQHQHDAAYDIGAAARGPPPLPPAVISTAAAASAAPSTHSNLEENNMMKREMQNQMAFQNKMRALKQQELNKYRRGATAAAAVGSSVGGVGDGGEQQHLQQQQPQRQTVAFDETTIGPGTAAADSGYNSVTFAEQDFQGGAGGDLAAAGDNQNRDRSRSISFSATDDDFWQTDVVDEQLFEFLMNN